MTVSGSSTVDLKLNWSLNLITNEQGTDCFNPGECACVKKGLVET